MRNERLTNATSAHGMRSRCAWAVCCGLLLAANTVHAQPPAETAPVRLPPVRLPAVAPLAPARDAQVEDGEVVLFAAQAVEFTPPAGWWIWEVAVGREVRLALSPARPRSLRDMPRDGLWICYHVRPPGAGQPHEELGDFLAARLRLVTRNKAIARPPRHYRWGSRPAVEQTFMLPSGQPGPPPDKIAEGSHVLVRTQWGILELHVAPAAAADERSSDQVAAMLAGLELHAPRVAGQGGGDVAWTRDAQAVLGCWKSYRSRMRLFGDGRIEILTDAPAVLSPPDHDFQPPRRDRLTGRFHAEADLLFVEWDDGSKLNFRWSLQQGNLLLTDHEGRISQLRRLLE